MPFTSLTMREEIVGEQLVRQPRPVGGHAVEAFDRANRDGELVGARIAHHAHALHRQQHGEALPEPLVPARPAHFLGDDGVGRCSSASRSRVIAPSMRTARPGPGKRLADQELVDRCRGRGRRRALRP